MKLVTHNLGWFSDLIEIFKNSSADKTTKISSSTSSTNAFNKLFENLGNGFGDVFDAIEQIGIGVDIVLQTLGEGLSEIYQHLRELDEAILETRKIAETNRAAIFCCIGLMLLFFIITMTRIGKLKHDNEELKNNIKRLDDKINSLTGLLQGFLIASKSSSTNATPEQTQETPENFENEKDQTTPQNQEKPKQQVFDAEPTDGMDISEKMLIYFALGIAALIAICIVVALITNSK